MRILFSFPGNLNTVPMNGYVLKALRELGHEVIPFNYQYDNLAERAYKRLSLKRLNDYKNKKLLYLATRLKPDLFFTIYGAIHTAAVVEAIRAQVIRTACWWLNDPFQLPFAETDAAPAYDYFFSNSEGTHADYHRHGVRHCHFLPVGIDPDTHRNLGYTQKQYDIIFAGDHHITRERLLGDLIRMGFNIAIMGPWHRKLDKHSFLHDHIVHRGFFTPAQMVDAYNKAHIVLNLHTWIDRWPYGLNPRLFEAAGCGAFQLVDFKAEMTRYFVNGRNMVWFNDVRELPNLLSYYLWHTAERRVVAERAFNVVQHHTYVHRMTEMLDVVCSTQAYTPIAL